jgi:protein TonB
MHFSHINDGTGGKAGKFAFVAGLHVVLALGAMNAMQSKAVKMPALLDDTLVWLKPEIPPPPPPQPPHPQARVSKPAIAVPTPEVETTPPPVQEQVQATNEPEPMPEPALASSSDAPPAQPATTGNGNPGTMRSAVLMDAAGCATPAYPPNAARNGETGTVTLALMVGADGRVQGSRVQKSSGSRDLDRAAVAALSMCQFKPAMNGGVAEAGWAQIAYVWTLE